VREKKAYGVAVAATAARQTRNLRLLYRDITKCNIHTMDTLYRRWTPINEFLGTDRQFFIVLRQKSTRKLVSHDEQDERRSNEEAQFGSNTVSFKL
jgi:hypothetical protein